MLEEAAAGLGVFSLGPEADGIVRRMAIGETRPTHGRLFPEASLTERLRAHGRIHSPDLLNIPGRPRKIEVSLDEEIAQGQYVNMARIFHNQTEFVLDALFLPPQSRRATVRSRMILAPVHAKFLHAALGKNIQLFESKHGKIDTTAMGPAPPAWIREAVAKPSLGDPAPGTRSATFGLLSPVATASGAVIYSGVLVGSGVDASNDTGIWSDARGPLELIVREGDVAPGAGGATFGVLRSPHANDRGQLVFESLLVGPGVSPADDSGLSVPGRGGARGPAENRGATNGPRSL